jgi:hypothetical protein
LGPALSNRYLSGTTAAERENIHSEVMAILVADFSVDIAILQNPTMSPWAFAGTRDEVSAPLKRRLPF